MKFAIALGVLWFATTQVLASEPVVFERTIRPILKQHCWHCHGEEAKLEGGFDARLAKYLLRGGDSGSAIEPGDHKKSLLYQRISAHEMPPGDKKVRKNRSKQSLIGSIKVRRQRVPSPRASPSAT